MMFPHRRPAAVGGHHNGDGLRKHWGVMWDVIFVRQDQLQRVTPYRQIDFGFGLAGAKMEMVEVIRDRLVKRRQAGIDQQWWCPVFAFSKPAGATPMPTSPKRTIGVGVTYAPSTG